MEALGQLEDGIATTFLSGLAVVTAIADLIVAGGTLVLLTDAYYVCTP